MKILARQLTMDLYNCKNSKLKDIEATKKMLGHLLNLANCQPIDLHAHELSEDHFVVLSLFEEGHILLHVYPGYRYVAGDIFLFREDASPELFFKEIRSFFKPDKTKTTFLKRGDFSASTEVRPKIKTRVAPLRKIHNTGAKVIRILARRNRQ